MPPEAGNVGSLPVNRESRQVEREAEAAAKKVALTSKNPRVRVDAAKRLGELRSGAEELVRSLNDSNGMVRAAAAQALGSAAEDVEPQLYQEVVISLMAAIDDSNDFVCSAAIHSLGRLKAEESREQIMACLDDPNAHIVEAAILALARLGPAEVASRLVGYLDGDHEWLQAAAVRAVGMLDYTPAGSQLMVILEKGLGKLPGERLDFLLSQVIQAIARLKVLEATPLLVRVARQEVGLRTKAVQALIDLNAAEAAPLLIDMLTDPGNSLRFTLLKMMVKARYLPALPVIRSLLEDSNSQIRQAALDAVVVMRDTASLKRIRHICISDANPFIRVRAVNGMVILAGFDAFDDLRKLAFDPNTYVRQAVAQNMGLLEPFPTEAIEILRSLVSNDPSPLVVETAREVLASVPERSFEMVSQHPMAAQVEVSMAPVELAPASPAIIDALELWQNSLAEHLKGSDPEKIAEIDQAITVLLRHLVVQPKKLEA
jgi:HEAT repeat protein